ncbi:MAG: glycoside hydrolase family 15 protein [Candidatus Jettenia caeni]|nr:MAG: glycoside hydrolase family 15 protein [Candidatus Jettenia caeni]
MPRELTIGNGSLQVMFDDAYRLRDIYFPHVGQENHTVGHAFRFGIFIDGQLSWIHEPDWERVLVYKPDTLVTAVKLINQRFELMLDCRDAVDFHDNIYLREVIVHNLANRLREIRLFFHQDFHLYENNIADTALYEPRLQAIIHYKANRYFLVNAKVDTMIGIEEWAIGIKEYGRAEGTWRDAEDGQLGKNPIEQGSVDSTIALRMTLPVHGQAACYYWITAGTKFSEIRSLNAIVIDKSPVELIDHTEDYWRIWMTKGLPNFADLPSGIVDLYKRSLLTIRTMTDNHGGIIAANDSDLLQFGRDTYSYVWPRDAARAAYALTRTGYIDIPRNFFRFCADVITDEGYLLHKYNPDRSLGSSWHPWYAREQMEIPIQEDGTALVLWALWQHFIRHKDIDFANQLYKHFIIRAADFLEDYRFEDTGLPRPSYDLWEERYGVHTFTVATVYGGLIAAAHFAESFRDQPLAEKYRRAAFEIQEAAKRILYSPQDGRFAQRFNPDTKELDLTIDASLFGVTAFGLFPADNPMVVSTMRQIEDRLTVKTEVGGIARYERDRFVSVTEDFKRIPGNPWIICTLWLAQYKIAAAHSLEQLQSVIDILLWVTRHTRPSGALPEQLYPFGERLISVCPLSWSHAEFIITVLDYLDKYYLLGGNKR